MDQISRFHPGINSLNSLNRLAEAGASAGVGVADAQTQARGAQRKSEGGFYAQLTGTPEGGSAGEYTFCEMYLDADGALQLLADGRGTETGEKAAEINATTGLPDGLIVWIQQVECDADTVLYLFCTGSGATTFAAKITGSTSVSANRWKYAWTEQELNTDGTYYDKTGGRSSGGLGYAYNRLEAFNTATGVQGCGINVDNLPAGWELKPIGGGVVEIRMETDCEGNPAPMFQASNLADGTC